MGDAGGAITAPLLSPRATEVAHAWLAADVYSELNYQARLARLHPDQLTAQIITAALVLGEVNQLLERARAVLES